MAEGTEGGQQLQREHVGAQAPPAWCDARPTRRFLVYPPARGSCHPQPRAAAGGAEGSFCSQVVLAQSGGQLLHFKKRLHSGLDRVVLPLLLLHGFRQPWVEGSFQCNTFGPLFLRLSSPKLGVLSTAALWCMGCAFALTQLPHSCCRTRLWAMPMGSCLVAVPPPSVGPAWG